MKDSKEVQDFVESLYKDMENEYGVNLTKEVDHVKNVLEDIPEAIRKVELK